MGFASGFVVGQRAGEALGGAISSALQKNGIDKDVADAMATEAAKTVGGDYGKSMGLEGADQQAAQLREQDNAFGMEGASSTANALNSNAADPTKAGTGGLSERYSLFGQESDKPFTQEQTDAARMSRVADIYVKHGLTDKAFALKDKIKADSRSDKEFTRKEAGWAKEDAADARAAAVQQGITGAFSDQQAAKQGSADYATYQGDIAKVTEGKGIDAVIRENAGKDATAAQIDAAIEAYRGSLDDATQQHNAAGMKNLYEQQAKVFGAIGGDPVKAAAALKLAESEGVPQLIESLKAGNVDEANRLWNSSGQGRGIIKNVVRDNKSGDMIATVIDPYSGAKSYQNISAMERALMSAEQVAKLRETESKIGENQAQAAAAYANADQSRAGAGKARAETAGVGLENDYMRTHGGEKPSKAGDSKGYKVDGSEVMKQLGSPVMDARGRPVLDGNQNPLYNRNQAEERAFYTWMDKSGIKDTNEGLARWLAGARDTAMPKPAQAVPVKHRKALTDY